MAHNVKTQPGVLLDRLLEMSALQRKAIEEGRIEELMNRHGEREALFTDIKRMDPAELNGHEAKRAIDNILESDRDLAAHIESSMEDLVKNLAKVSSGKKASAAYSR
ncbi:MAG: flagellar protein FliT [Deltaproteobacteria bacterium]|nr:flagellar protein FliT [Deltaproteobacteria bacterium]